MLTVNEKIKPPIKGYYKTFYVCPYCKMEFPMINSVYFCMNCRKSIIDIKAVLDNTNYALRYHFGFIPEVRKRILG